MGAILGKFLLDLGRDFIHSVGTVYGCSFWCKAKVVRQFGETITNFHAS